MKKILVTGSNGLLGQKITDIIASKANVELYATSRGTDRYSGPSEGKYSYHSLDITKVEEVNAVFDQIEPDVVIHTAAMTNVDQCETEKEACWDLNVNAVKYLLTAAAKFNSFFLHLSTDFIFNGEEGPYTEEGVPDPISYYGESKLAAEKLVEESDLRWAIARTVLVYGITAEMSRSNIVLWVKNSIEAEKDINVVNDQWRSPTLAEDLAIGCFLIAEKEVSGIFNISGKDFLTPYEMALKTADFFSLDKKFIHETDGSKFQQTAKRPPKTGFVIDKAVRELGYAPRSFDEGIAVLQSQLNK